MQAAEAYFALRSAYQGEQDGLYRESRDTRQAATWDSDRRMMATPLTEPTRGENGGPGASGGTCKTCKGRALR